MRINQFTKIHGQKVILVPYEACHVPKYHGWMSSEELQMLTGSEPLTLEQEYEMQKSWREDENKCTFIILDAELYNKNKNEIEAMVGDVNLFFNELDDPSSAEIEIMIAETTCRGKGLGKESLLLMMLYGSQKLNIKRITAKIGINNTPSNNMFTKLHFKEVSRSDVFQEVTYELMLSPEVVEWLETEVGRFTVIENKNNTI